MSSVNFGHLVSTSTTTPFVAVLPNGTPVTPEPRKQTLPWTKRRPKRITRNTWYFIEDNTVPDGQVLLQSFVDTHGEARCSAPTKRILDGSDPAQRELLAHYGEAREAMPATVMVDINKYAPSDLRSMRRAIDPMVQLRDGVDELLTDLMKCKGEPDSYRAAELVAQYARLRDRVALLRNEFREIEDAFELMQDKLVSVMGGDDA